MSLVESLPSIWTVLTIVGSIVLLALGAVAVTVFRWRASAYSAPGIPQDPNPHWFWGHMRGLIDNLDRMWDWHLEQAMKWDKDCKRGAIALLKPNLPPTILLTSPENMEFLFSSGFDYFVKRMPDLEYSRTAQEVFGQGIFSVDGPEWRRQRKLYSYHFATKHLRDDMYTTFESIVDKLFHKLDQYVESGERFDLQNLFARLTMEGICSIALGQDLGAIEADDPPPFLQAFDLTQLYSAQRHSDVLWKAKRFFQIGERERGMTRELKVMHDFVYNVIDKIRAGNYDKERFNILTLALDRAKKSGVEISNEELKDIVMSFCIAGRDTTACQMSWMMYELTQHKDVRENVHEEISQLHGDFSYEAITRNTPYLGSVILESQRIHPSVPADQKIVKKDVTLPSGLKLKKNWLVSYYPYIFGRNKNIWGQDAEEFKPERFADGDRPFGESKYPMFNGGPRLCLGKTMAILETKYVIARLLDRYEFSICEDTLPIDYVVSILLWMKGGLWMTAKHRTPTRT